MQRGLRERQDSDRVRLWRGALELVAASLAGIIRDEVLWRGFAMLDEEDLREWLARHGASERTLARSPVLRGLYDLTFAYREGDKQRPSLAAGKALQSLLMMINYEGSFMWRSVRVWERWCSHPCTSRCGSEVCDLSSSRGSPGYG